MRRTVLTALALATLATLLWAQRGSNTSTSSGSAAQPTHARFEVHSVFPLETSPGIYQQVDQSELQLLADQGWELVGVEPYVIRNEARGPDMPGPQNVVTQTYPAYFFKRERLARQQ